MRCIHCHRRIRCPYGIWRLVDTNSMYCAASRTGYHAIYA